MSRPQVSALETARRPRLFPARHSGRWLAARRVYDRHIGKYGPHRDPEVRARILEATREIIAVEGPGGASVGAIASAAGAGKQTIYRWWPSRTALVADALQEIFERESAFPVTVDPIDDLRTQMAAVAKVMRSPAGSMIRELLADAQADPEVLSMFRERFFERRREQARHALERGVASGVLRADLDPTTVIDLLYAPLWLRLLTRHGALTKSAANRIIDTALVGIAAPRAM